MTGNPLILREMRWTTISFTLSVATSLLLVLRPVLGWYGSKMGAATWLPLTRSDDIERRADPVLVTGAARSREIAGESRSPGDSRSGDVAGHEGLLIRRPRDGEGDAPRHITLTAYEESVAIMP
jgi:hypothetical protein